MVSHYEIIEKIGGGAMGVVYRARDTRLDRDVALKFLPSELTRDELSKKRFVREAQTAFELEHPNICRIHGIDEAEDGQLFISMSYYEGESLRARMEKATFSYRGVFDVALGIARGLEEAHRKGVIHRDIKPANVMITSEGVVKIVDFGLAKLAGSTRVTRTDVTVGTAAYMSPEQATGDEVDARTDIWSLGAVMYEMTTGKRPFRGDVDAAVLYSIMNEEPRPIVEVRPDVPAGLRSIINRCLSKERSQRYASTEELITDLIVLAREEGWESAVTEVIERRDWRRRRNRARYVLISVSALAIAAAAWWYIVHRGSDSVYSTRLRLAVVGMSTPGDHPDADALFNGLMEWTHHAVETICRAHESMWLVPYDRTLPGQIPGADAAAVSFGVNRVLTGRMQRYGDGYRFTLELADAVTMRTIEQKALDFAMGDLLTLREAVAGAIADFVGLPFTAADRARLCEAGPPTSASLGRYFEGLGLLQHPDRADNLSRALAALEAVVAENDSFALAHAALGLASRKEHEATADPVWLERSMQHARRAIALDPMSTGAYFTLGSALVECDSTDAAKATYRRLIAVDSTSTNAYHRLALLLTQERRFEEAEELYLEAIAQKPDYYRGYGNLGWFYDARERDDEAIAAYTRSLELAPRVGWVLNNLGFIYYRLEDWTRARDLFQQAYAIRPSCSTASNIGTLLYLEGRYGDAVRYYELSVDYCDSTRYLVWGNLASACYWTQEERPRARQAYLRAIELAETELRESPDDALIMGHLIDYYAMTDQRDRVLQMIEESAAYSDIDSRLMFRIALAYEKLGERNLALRYLGDAIRHHYSLRQIMGEPMLADLREDVRFQQMLDSQRGAESSD